MKNNRWKNILIVVVVFSLGIIIGSKLNRKVSIVPDFSEETNQNIAEDLEILDGYIRYCIEKYCDEFNIVDNFTYDIYEDIFYENLESINVIEEGYKGDLGKEITERLVNDIYFFKIYGEERNLYLKINTHNMKFYVYEMDKEGNSVVGDILIIDRELVGLNEAYDRIIREYDDGPILMYYPDDYVDTDLGYDDYRFYNEKTEKWEWSINEELYTKINLEFNYKDYDNIKTKNVYENDDKICNLIGYSFIEYFKRNNTTDVITIDLELKPSPNITNMVFTLKIEGEKKDYYIDLDTINLKSHIYEIDEDKYNG